MRLILGAACLLGLACPGIARAQLFELHASAGPTLVDRGYSLAVGGGVSPTSRVSVLVDYDRTHLTSRSTDDGRGSVSTFRGGTLTLAAAQVRVTVRPNDRVGPYGLAGFAAGRSRPNVNQQFPNPVTNDVRAAFFGGGLHVPMGRAASLFVDGRMMVGSEAGELLAVAPIRAGLAWRF
jgi:hypothetical protein